MPRALVCIWLMAWREFGLARAALLRTALGKGRRGQNHGSRYDHFLSIRFLLLQNAWRERANIVGVPDFPGASPEA